MKTIVNLGPGLKIIELFSCTTQLSEKFTRLINVKMPTIIGILRFMNKINVKIFNKKNKKTVILFIYSVISFL